MKDFREDIEELFQDLDVFWTAFIGGLIVFLLAVVNLK